MLYGLDIETEQRELSTADLDNKWVQKKLREDKLALYPQYNRITKIGVYAKGVELVFNSVSEFSDWYSANDCRFILHNGPFDIFNLHYHGCDINLDHYVGDSQLVFHIIPDKIPAPWLKKYNKKRDQLNKDLPSGVSHRLGNPLSLKTLAPFHLGVKPFWENPSNHADDVYVLKDCRYTLELHEYGVAKLREQGFFDFYINEMRKARLLLRMKINGFPIDVVELEKMIAEYDERLRVARAAVDVAFKDPAKAWKERETQLLIAQTDKSYEAYVERLKDKSKAEAGFERYQKSLIDKIKRIEPLNFDSPTQMKWVIKDFYGLPCSDYTGKEGAGAEILEGLVQRGESQFEALLEYREVEKRANSYFPAYSALQVNGCLHANWNQTTTRTGRLSSSDPNLQQVSPDLKNLFVAPPGWKFVCRDASAIEAKLICYYSDDPELFKIISNGWSIHDYRLKHVFFHDIEPRVRDTPMEEIKKKFPKERNATKGVGFARFYGAGSGLIQGTLTKHGFKVSEIQGQAMYHKDRQQFLVATQFHQSITEEFKNGAVICNMFGRPIKIERKSDCYMKGFNTLIQGSASDLNVQAQLETEAEIGVGNPDAFPIGLVHDECIFLAKDEVADEVDRILVDKMTRYRLECAHGVIPLTTEGGVFDVWQK